MAYDFDDFKSEGLKGSHITCLNALKVLEDHLNNYKKKDLVNLGEELNRISRDIIKLYPNLVKTRENVTSIVYYTKRLIKAGKSLPEIQQLISDKLKELRMGFSAQEKKIGEYGTRLIQNNSSILTISYSTMLKSIFTTAQMQNKKFQVYCMESRPAFEGRTFAIELASLGIKTHLITDAMIGQVMPDIKMVLTGADRIFSTTYVSKAGSLPLAVVAGAFNVPVYVAMETDKILAEHEQALRFYPEKGNDVFDQKKKNLDVISYYFESVPLDHVAKIVCEEGIFDVNEFKKWYLED